MTWLLHWQDGQGCGLLLTTGVGFSSIPEHCAVVVAAACVWAFTCNTKRASPGHHTTPSTLVQLFEIFHDVLVSEPGVREGALADVEACRERVGAAEYAA